MFYEVTNSFIFILEGPYFVSSSGQLIFCFPRRAVIFFLIPRVRLFFFVWVEARIFFLTNIRARIFFSKKTHPPPPPWKSNGRSLNHLAYADDLVLLCPSLKGLQRLVHECQIYGINNGITYNCNKTVCMSLLSRKFTISSKPSIVLYDKELKFVDKYKYLGFNMNNECNDDSDINRQMRSFYIRINYLISS